MGESVSVGLAYFRDLFSLASSWWEGGTYTLGPPACWLDWKVTACSALGSVRVQWFLWELLGTVAFSGVWRALAPGRLTSEEIRG